MRELDRETGTEGNAVGKKEMEKEKKAVLRPGEEKASRVKKVPERLTGGKKKKGTRKNTSLGERGREKENGNATEKTRPWTKKKEEKN